MAEFTEQQKQFVIRCWASDLQSDEIATKFVEHFNTEEDPVVRPLSAQLARYNPAYDSCSLSPAHMKLYQKAKKTFQEDLGTIPIFHKAYRVRELGILYLKQKKKSDVIAADLLEQAAREVGGLYEQKQVAGTPAEIEAFIHGMAVQLRGAVERNVKDPEERKRVNDELKEVMEAAGK